MKIEEIQIERYVPQRVQWYKNDGTYLGEVHNEHELNKLRIQLVENDLTQDCYFMWLDIKMTMGAGGDLNKWPRGMYDQVNQDMCTLFKLQKTKQEKSK